VSLLNSKQDRGPKEVGVDPSELFQPWGAGLKLGKLDLDILM
jgi:hypothetical protein